MKKSKILLGSFSTMALVATPIATVVSCGKKTNNTRTVEVNIDNAIAKTIKDTKKWNSDNALLTRNFVTLDASQYAKIKGKIWEYKNPSKVGVKYTGDLAAFKAYAGKVFINKADKTINLFATNEDVDKYLAEKMLKLSELKSEGTWVVGNTTANPFFAYPNLGSTIADKSNIFGFNTTTNSFVAKGTGVAASATLLDISKSAARSYLYTNKLAFNFETKGSKFMVEKIGSTGSSVTGFFDIVIKVKANSGKKSEDGTDLSNKYIWFNSDQLTHVLEYFGASTIAELKTKVDFIVGKDSTPSPFIKTQFQSINEATTVDTEHLGFDTKTWTKTVGFDSLNSKFRDPASWLVGDVLKQLLNSWGKSAPHLKAISDKLAKYKDGQNNGFQILGGKIIRTILKNKFLTVGRNSVGVLELFNKINDGINDEIKAKEKYITELEKQKKQMASLGAKMVKTFEVKIKAAQTELAEMKKGIAESVVTNLFLSIASNKPKNIITQLLSGLLENAGPVFDDAGIKVGEFASVLSEISGHPTNIKLILGGKSLVLKIPKFNLPKNIKDMINKIPKNAALSDLLNIASSVLTPEIGKALSDVTLAELIEGKSLLKSAEPKPAAKSGAASPAKAASTGATAKKAPSFDIKPFAKLLYKILNGLNRIDTKQFGTMKFSEDDKKLIISTFKFSKENTDLFANIIENIVSMYNKI